MPFGSEMSNARRPIPAANAQIIGSRRVVTTPSRARCPLTMAGPSPNTKNAPVAKVIRPRSSPFSPSASRVRERPKLPTFGKIVVATSDRVAATE